MKCTLFSLYFFLIIDFFTLITQFFGLNKGEYLVNYLSQFQLNNQRKF